MDDKVISDGSNYYNLLLPCQKEFLESQRYIAGEDGYDYTCPDNKAIICLMAENQTAVISKEKIAKAILEGCPKITSCTQILNICHRMDSDTKEVD